MGKKKRRKLAAGRYNESYSSKDDGGSTHKTIFDFKAGGMEEPKKYQPKDGLNKLVIVPYEIKTKNHPLVKKGKVEIGDLDYSLDVWVHKYVGASDADILCPKKTYGKPCPICDMVKALYDSKDEDDEIKAKSIKAKRRVIYNVIPVQKGEMAEEILMFDVSHYLFEKELIEEANDCSDGSDIIPFADIDEGSIIKFRKTMEKIGTGEMPKYKSFDFLEREEELDDELIDDASSFDAALILLTPDEIMALYNGDDEDEDEEEPPKKSKKKKKKVEPEEEEEEEEEEDEDEEEPPKKSKRKGSGPKPGKEKETKKKRKQEPEEEEEEDEDEDEDEEESPKKSKRKTKEKSSDKKKKVAEDECPYGHEFGTDCDEHKDCNRCNKWDECQEAQEG